MPGIKRCSIGYVGKDRRVLADELIPSAVRKLNKMQLSTIDRVYLDHVPIKLKSQ